MDLQSHHGIWYTASICCIDGIGLFGWLIIDAMVDFYLQTRLTFKRLHRRQIFSFIPGTYESLHWLCFTFLSIECFFCLSNCCSINLIGYLLLVNALLI